MDRRTLLQAIGVVGTGTIGSGCITNAEEDDDVQDTDGDGVIDSQDYAPRDPDVQEESDLGNPSPTPESTETSSSQVEKDILSTYNKGVRHQNRGMNGLNASIKSFNHDNYGASVDHADGAIEKFELARETWNEAHNTALQTDYSEVQQICDDAVTYATRMIAAAKEARKAAEDAQNGRMGDANGHINKQEQNYQSARELGLKDPETVKQLLGV